jgi:hypothetical protein
MHEPIAVELANPGTHVGHDGKAEEIGMDCECENEDERKDDESQSCADSLRGFEPAIFH